MVADIVRDSFFGWCCRFVTGGRVFKYSDEIDASIWRRYLAVNDDTVGIAITRLDQLQPPPKSLRRDITSEGGLVNQQDFVFNEHDQQAQTTDPQEQEWFRRVVHSDDDDVRATGVLQSKALAATLVQEIPARPSVSAETRKGVPNPPRPLKLRNSPSATTLLPSEVFRDAEHPPLARQLSDNEDVRTAAASKPKHETSWLDIDIKEDRKPDLPSKKSKSSDVKRYFIGFEFFKYVSCIAFVGYDHVISTSSTPHLYLSHRRPVFTGDKRTTAKTKRPYSTGDIYLQEIKKTETEQGLDDFENLLDDNCFVDQGDWQVERREGIYVVGWYGPNDRENPQNWSSAKKAFVTLEVCMLTFAVYIAAAIWSSAVNDVVRVFGVSTTASLAGISLYVFGYALGPIVWSPLSDIPAVGRTNVYILTLAVFTALQVPTYLATEIVALLVLRFIAGFIGSPSLAIGGASIAEIYTPTQGTYAIAFWGLFGTCGPTLGPLIGGFSVEAGGWSWTMLVVLWIAGFMLVVLVFFLPETSAANILHKRAIRLRKVTGNPNLVCEADLAAHGRAINVRQVLVDTLVRPFAITFTEPIVLALNLYAAFIYGLLYLWFESFPIVFIEIYGFGLGTSGLMFLGILIGAILTVPPYFWWLHKSVEPKVAKLGDFVPEWILPPCYVGAVALPLSLFLFGWTSRESIHWMVPVVGTAFFSVAIVLLFNALLNYLVLAYPTEAASVLAGNDLSRGLVGASFPLYGGTLYHNLGIAWGSSVIGFIALAFLPVPIILVRYGPWLRRRSKLARHDL